MPDGNSATIPQDEPFAIRHHVARFQSPVLWRSLLQVATSFGGFVVVCVAMYAIYDTSYWIALALAPLAAGFLVRIFIVQHDCGHVALFRSRRTNDLVGRACGLLTLTPYRAWRRQHAGHHAVWNDLDRRESGADFYSSCLTVAEYRRLGRWGRLRYRAVRHPLVSNVLLPPLIFILLYRVPFDTPRSWRAERRSVHLTNLALLAALGGLGLLVGFGRLAAVQIPVMVLASIAGVWLFSVQHRGAETRWIRHEDWRPDVAALEGSTFLRLPSLLQWFTGNIGYHHVHHLNARVPNYRLQACHETADVFRSVPEVGIGGAFRALRHVLWDEEQGRMVTAREAAPAVA